MPGTIPVINTGVPPGGNIGVQEANLPQGTSPSGGPVRGSWAFSIKADDGVKDFTVGSYTAIKDGVLQSGYADYGYGKLWVSAYDPATGSITVSFELTGAYQNAPGSTQKYGDIISYPLVLTDKDGDQATSSLVVQIRDDEGITLKPDSFTVNADATVTGSLIGGATPDIFGADGFGGVTQVGVGPSGPPVAPEDGEFILRGAYGNLFVSTSGSFTYRAFSDAPDGARDSFNYWAKDGDGDERYTSVVFTIHNASSPPPTLSFATPDLTAAEGSVGNGATLTYRVQLSSPSTQAVTANWAVSGGATNPASDGDFASGSYPSGTLTFAPGETVKTISVTVLGDYIAEPDERFTVTLSNITGASGGTTTAVGTIADDDSSTPSQAGQVIVSPRENSSISGGAGNDTITASNGGDTITSGGGADTLIFKAYQWSPAVITDFALGTDKLDYQPLKSTYGGSDPVADRYITFLDDGNGGTKILYDWDGAGSQQQWPQYVIWVQKVPTAGLTWNQLVNPGGAAPPPDNQPTISPTPTGTPGGLSYTLYEKNLSNGTSPDAGQLVKTGELYLRAGDGVDALFNNQTAIIQNGVFTPTTITTFYNEQIRFTAYDAATGKLSFEYQMRYAVSNAGGMVNGQPASVLDRINLMLRDKDGDTTNAQIDVTIVDDVPVTRDDTDSIAAGSTSPATGDVITDASQGDAGDSDSGRDLRGADQSLIYSLASTDTGASTTTFSSGYLVVNGRYGQLQMSNIGTYAYTLTGNAPAGAVEHFTYVLKDNDLVTGHLDITITDPGSATGQRYVSPGANSTVVAGAGDDTLVASQGGDVMTGGAGADLFSLPTKPWSPIEITDFAVGTDRLDLSSLLQSAGYTGSDPIGDKYVWLVDDGAGGTKVLWDRDGAAAGQQWPDYIVHLQKVPLEGLTWAKLTGSGEPPPPPPPTNQGQVINSGGAGSTLQGTSGNDTLNSSQGPDVLIGGAGADNFVFAAENWAPATIKDFEKGVDHIDLRGMFDAVGYTGSDPFGAGYLTLIDDGAGGTKVLFDRDAGGPTPQWPNYVLHVENVAPSQLATTGNWIFQ